MRGYRSILCDFGSAPESSRACVRGGVEWSDAKCSRLSCCETHRLSEGRQLMFREAMAKFEKGVRRFGAVAEGCGKDLHAVCDEFGEAFAELRGEAPAEQPPRRRSPRPRQIPPPSRPVTEMEQARAERELKKRGFSVGEE